MIPSARLPSVPVASARRNVLSTPSRIGNQERSIPAQEFSKGLNFFLNYRFVCSHVIHLQLDPLK